MASKPTYADLEKKIEALVKQNNQLQKNISAFTELRLFPNLCINIPAMCHSIDENGTIVDVSELWLAKMGYTKEEVIGRKSTDFLSHKSKIYAQEIALPQFFDQGFIENVPYQFITKDGAALEVLLSAISLKAASGDHHRSLAIMTDITERKQAEKELKRSEIRFRNVLETLELIAVSLNDKGKIIFCNDFLLKLTGWKREEILGKSWFDTFLPVEIRNEIKQSVFLKTIETGVFPAHYQNEIITRYGSLRLINWNNTIFQSPDGHVVNLTSIGEDITERRAAEEACRQAEMDLQLLNKDLERRVRDRTAELAESNAALRVVLRQMQNEKRQLGDRVMASVKELVNPVLARLKKKASTKELQVLLATVESNLKNIISPFANNLSSKHYNLTPMQIQVAVLVKGGKTNKEIAESLGVSLGTVLTHRHHVRDKLGLKKTGINLRAHLMSLE